MIFNQIKISSQLNLSISPARIRLAVVINGYYQRDCSAGPHAHTNNKVITSLIVFWLQYNIRTNNWCVILEFRLNITWLGLFNAYICHEFSKFKNRSASAQTHRSNTSKQKRFRPRPSTFLIYTLYSRVYTTPYADCSFACSSLIIK
jgi:hypothetical protein